MKGKQFFILLLILLFFYNNALSQCPSGIEIINSVNELNISSVPDNEKVNKLEKIRSHYLKCNGNKDSVYARIAHRLGYFYNKVGNTEKAIAFTKEAVAINTSSTKGAEKSYAVGSYLNLGIFYSSLNILNEAHLYLDSCINLGNQYPEKNFIVLIAYDHKAFTFFQTGDYQKSIETADKGIFLAKSERDSLSEANLLSQKAQAQLALNHLSEAQKNITKSIDILQKNTDGSKYLPTAYSTYALYLNKTGNNKAAIEYYKKAIGINKEKLDSAQVSRNLLNLGLFYDKDLHQPSKAIACYNEGLKMIKNTNDVYQKSALYINLGVVHWREKNLHKSLQFFQKALNIIPIHFNDTAIKSNPSKDKLKLVANNYYVSSLLSNKGELLLELYKKENNKNYLYDALNAFEAADFSIEQMRWKQFGEESKLYWRENTKRMYELAIDACYLLQDVDKAFYFFEKSRAVLLNDRLSDLNAKKYLSLTDRAKEQQIRIKLFSLQRALENLPQNTKAYNENKKALLNVKEEWEQFIKSLEKRYPAYYQNKYDNTFYTLSQTKKKLLPHNKTLVEYFTGDSAIYILSLSTEKDILLKINYPNYTETVKKLLTLLSNKAILNQSYTIYKSLSYELYQNLFKPLNVIKGSVCISPDVHFIPFDALLSDPNSPTSFLLKNYAFAYTYSAHSLMKKIARHKDAKNSFLGIAPVTYNKNLEQKTLLGADASLKNIEPYFSQATFLTNEKATKNNFLASFPSHRIVQVYSHADADSLDLQPVLFMGDSVIQLSEIQTLDNLQTDMIVLSACKTAIGKNAKGEGIFSLARAFMAAGIGSTVTSLWQIDDKATYLLTETFYKYLSEGHAADIALQKAKLDLLNHPNNLYALPYYWAAVIIIGKTDALGEAAPVMHIGYKIAIVIFSLTLIATVFFLLKKYGAKLSNGKMEKRILQ